MSNMEAIELVRTRVVYSDVAFAELVLWQLPSPLAGSKHRFKYRLAYVVDSECVLRYDNEVGKGDHRHVGTHEMPYVFVSVDQLLDDFLADVAAWKGD